jgi:hypothetical protein
MSTVDELRAVALALPEAEERETWGTSTFRVRDRIFAILGESGESVTVKATPQEQALLLSSDPETFAYAAYVGRFGWVSVRLASVDTAVLRGLLREAWRSSAPKKLARGLEPADAS